MATDLVHVLLEAAAESHPFARERFGHLVAELEESPPGAALAATPDLPGPVDEAEGWVRGWLSGLAETTQANALPPVLRGRLAAFGEKHGEADRWLPHWGAALLVDVGSTWRPSLRLTVAEFWAEAAAYTERAAKIARLGGKAADVARQAAQAFQTLLPTLETEAGFSDFTILERRLAEVLKTWAEGAAGAHPVAQEVMFIREFLAKVAPLHTGDDRFWHGLLEGCLGPAVSQACPGLAAHPLTDALAVLAGANGRFEGYLSLQQEAPHLLTGGEPVSAALELVLLFQLVAEVPEVSLRERWRAALARSAMRSALAGPMRALQPQRQALVEWLRPRYERTLVDWLDGGLTYFVGLVDAAEAIEKAWAAQRTECQRLGDGLAVGQKGQNAASRMANLAAEMVGRAAWLVALTPNPKVTTGLYRRALVADIGLDVTEEVWKKHSQLQAGLLQVAASGGPALAGAKGLLAQVDLVAPTTRFRPEEVVLPEAVRDRLDAGSIGLPLKTPEWVVMRLCLDYRLGAERTFAQLTLGWLSAGLLAAAGGKHGALVRELVAETLAQARPQSEDDRLPESWRKAADIVGQELPRLTAARALPPQARMMAAETAAQVFRGHPEWTLGDDEGAERKGTARIEAMLRQAALVLDPGTGLDGAFLISWWAKDLGAKAAQEPTAQHEETLHALHRSLQRHLSTDEAERVFALVHDAYKEVLGVGVAAAALGSKPLIVEGPFHRQFLQEAKRWPAAALPTADELGKAAAAAGDHATEVGRQATILVRQVAISGDLEAAWQRVMPSLEGWMEETPVEDAAAAWGAMAKALVLLSPPRRRPLVLALFRPGVALCGQIGLGRRLTELADGYGAFAAGAAQRLLRKDFGVAQGREAERALAEALAGVAESIGRRLRADAPEIAYLNVVRRPLELVVAESDWTRRAWDFVLQALFRYVGPALTATEQRAAALWHARLDAAFGALPEFQPLAKTIFASAEYAFSARPEEEQTIRMAVSAIATAVLAERGRRGAGREVVVRLALATELPRYRDARKLETVFKLMATTLEDVQPTGWEAQLESARDIFKRLDTWSGRVGGAPGTAVLAALGADRDRIWDALRLAAPEDDRAAWEKALADFDGANVAVAVPASAERVAEASVTDTGAVAEAAQLLLAGLAGTGSLGELPTTWAAEGQRLASLLRDLDPGAMDSNAAVAAAEVAYPAWAPGWQGLADALDGVRVGTKLAAQADAAVAAADGTISVFSLDPSFGGFEPGRADLSHLVRALAECLCEARAARPGLPLSGFGRSQELAPAEVGRYAAWLHGLARAAAENAGERRVVAARWAETLLPGGGTGVTPTWLTVGVGQEPAWAAKALAASGDLAEAMAAAAGGGAPLGKVLRRQVPVVLASLGRGGEADTLVATVRPLLDGALDEVPEAALIAAWRSAGRQAPAALGAAWLPLLGTVGAAVATAVAEIASGRRWQDGADKLAAELRTQIPARGGDSLAGLSELLAGVIDVAGYHQRVGTTVEAAEADGRWAAGVLSLLGEAPRAAWLAAGRRVAEELSKGGGSMASRGASRRAAERLAELWSGVPTVRPALDLWRTGKGPWRTDGVSDAVMLSVVAAGLLPDTAAVSGRAILQRLVLDEAVWATAPAKAWGKRTTAWLEAWNEQTNRSVPAGVARRVSELPRTVELMERAREATGFPLGLGCALRSLTPGAKSLWGGTVLARAKPEVGLGSPEPVDLAVGQLAGWHVPEDAVVLARLKALDVVVSLEKTLGPAAPKADAEAKGGFLSSLFGRKKAEPAAAATDPNKYRAEAYDWLVRLAAAALVDDEVPGAVWLWEGEYKPRGGASEAEARATYHAGVAEAMAEQFGTTHVLAAAYRAAAEQVPAATLAWLVAAEAEAFAERLVKAMPGAGIAEIAALQRPLAAQALGLLGPGAGEGIGAVIHVGDRSVVATSAAQIEPLRAVLKTTLGAGERAAWESALQGLRQVAAG